MSLLRFDRTDSRGPSAALWQGLVDWVHGSLTAEAGQRDFEDFAPYCGADVEGGDAEINSCTQVSGTAGIVATHETDRYGVLNIAATAGANAQAGLARRIYFDLQNSDVTIIEARVTQNADADSPQAFVGFSDQANPDDVFAAGVINAGNNEDAIGILWNADETFDIVAVDDGTLTVLKNDIGVTVERTAGPCNIGLRMEKVTSTTYRMTPCINGAIARSGAVNVLATLLPEVPMRPVVATTVALTTAPSADTDWVYSADK